jgi:hypothetical protein
LGIDPSAQIDEPSPLIKVHVGPAMQRQGTFWRGVTMAQQTRFFGQPKVV